MKFPKNGKFQFGLRTAATLDLNDQVSSFTPVRQIMLRVRCEFR